MRVQQCDLAVDAVNQLGCSAAIIDPPSKGFYLLGEEENVRCPCEVPIHPHQNGVGAGCHGEKHQLVQIQTVFQLRLGSRYLIDGLLDHRYFGPDQAGSGRPIAP